MKISFLDFAAMHSAIKPEMQVAFNEVYDGYWYIIGSKAYRIRKSLCEI